jgi:hypothetical protein
MLCESWTGTEWSTIWLVSFWDYDLGYFDLKTRVPEPLTTRSAESVSNLITIVGSPDIPRHRQKSERQQAKMHGIIRGCSGTTEIS